MENFWNEITTTENEDKIEDEKSLNIDVDVKEKQQEIEHAIEEVLSPKQVRVTFRLNEFRQKLMAKLGSTIVKMDQIKC